MTVSEFPCCQPPQEGSDMSRDRRIAALVARGVTDGFAEWLQICTPGTLAEIEGLSNGTLKFLSNLDFEAGGAA